MCCGVPKQHLRLLVKHWKFQKSAQSGAGSNVSPSTSQVSIVQNLQFSGLGRHDTEVYRKQRSSSGSPILDCSTLGIFRTPGLCLLGFTPCQHFRVLCTDSFSARMSRCHDVVPFLSFFHSHHVTGTSSPGQSGSITLDANGGAQALHHMGRA